MCLRARYRLLQKRMRTFVIDLFSKEKEEEKETERTRETLIIILTFVTINTISRLKIRFLRLIIFYRFVRPRR